MRSGLGRKHTERAGALGNYSPELTSPSTRSPNQRSRAFEVAKVSIRPGVLQAYRVLGPILGTFRNVTRPCQTSVHDARMRTPSGSNFCLGCGTRLSLRCASCESDLPAGSRFCNKCGHAVTAGSVAERPFASPDQVGRRRASDPTCSVLQDRKGLG